MVNPPPPPFFCASAPSPRRGRSLSTLTWRVQTIMIEQSEAPQNRFRNTAFVIDRTHSHFDAAYERGIMGLHGKSLDRRRVRLYSAGDNDREIVDFVRCS